MKLKPSYIIKYIDNLIYKFNTKRKIKKLNLGMYGKHATLGFPAGILNPSLVYLHDYTRIHGGNIIFNYKGKFVMKEYSAASYGLYVVTGNHTPTVGIPQYMLGPSHVNDKEKDIVIEEDVWIGMRVTLIAGCHIGRGAIVGACSLVNKEIPPYAIVAGVPAKIKGCKFTIDQIIEHEKVLYPEEKRFSREYLENLFKTYYFDKKTIGLTSDLEKEGFYEFMKKRNYSYIKQ